MNGGAGKTGDLSLAQGQKVAYVAAAWHGPLTTCDPNLHPVRCGAARQQRTPTDRHLLGPGPLASLCPPTNYAASSSSSLSLRL